MKKKLLFVPFSDDDFLPGNLGADYLNKILFALIEQVNALERKIAREKKTKN